MTDTIVQPIEAEDYEGFLEDDDSYDLQIGYETDSYRDRE